MWHCGCCWGYCPPSQSYLVYCCLTQYCILSTEVRYPLSLSPHLCQCFCSACRVVDGTTRESAFPSMWARPEYRWLVPAGNFTAWSTPSARTAKSSKIDWKKMTTMRSCLAATHSSLSPRATDTCPAPSWPTSNLLSLVSSLVSNLKIHNKLLTFEILSFLSSFFRFYINKIECVTTLWTL